MTPMQNGIFRPTLRRLAPLVALGWLVGLSGTAAAASPADPVEGHSVRIVGISKQKSSFGDPIRGLDFLDLSFAADTFQADAVSGSYEQRGRQLRFHVDPARLRDYEASWEAAFLADLQAQGLEPESVACETTRSRVKGRVRNGRVKFTASYRFRCTASGPFGEMDAKAKRVFRGRGTLQSGPAALLGPGGVLGSGNAGLVVWIPVQPSQTTGSAGFTLAVGGAGLAEERRGIRPEDLEDLLSPEEADAPATEETDAPAP